MRGESRWDREDRLVAKGRRLLAFLNLGLVMCAILTTFALGTSVLVENGMVARAAWMQGHLSRDWPMCVENWAAPHQPFNPSRAPL